MHDGLELVSSRWRKSWREPCAAIMLPSQSTMPCSHAPSPWIMQQVTFCDGVFSPASETRRRLLAIWTRGHKLISVHEDAPNSFPSSTSLHIRGLRNVYLCNVTIGMISVGGLYRICVLCEGMELKVLSWDWVCFVTCFASAANELTCPPPQGVDFRAASEGIWHILKTLCNNPALNSVCLRTLKI